MAIGMRDRMRNGIDTGVWSMSVIWAVWFGLSGLYILGNVENIRYFWFQNHMVHGFVIRLVVQ